MQYIKNAKTLQFILCIPHGFKPDRVDEDEMSVRRNALDHVMGIVEEVTIPLLAFSCHFFRKLARGDVPADTDDVFDLSRDPVLYNSSGGL